MSEPPTLWRSPSGRPIESTLRQIIRDGHVAAGYARWRDPVAPGDRLVVLFGERYASMPEAAFASLVAGRFESLVEAARANEQAASPWGALSVVVV